MDFRTFGVVGLGNFGRFFAESLADHGEVLGTDADPANRPDEASPVRWADLAEVADADVVVLAVPFSALASVVAEVGPHLRPEAVVVDVTSTKAAASRVLLDGLGDHPNVVATHPLFGPPSMERVRAGDRIVVTDVRGARGEDLVAFLEGPLGLRVERVTADEHDHAMAYMQALPFFIARALVALDISHYVDEHPLVIPSFEKLLGIANIEQHHTDEMFATSQLSNPYADEARRHFLDALSRIQDELADWAEHAGPGNAPTT
jgi:prephenate dehydrogenase